MSICQVMFCLERPAADVFVCRVYDIWACNTTSRTKLLYVLHITKTRACELFALICKFCIAGEVKFISRVLQSLRFPASWVRHRPHHAVIAIRLQILLIKNWHLSTACSWSAIVRIHRQLIRPHLCRFARHGHCRHQGGVSVYGRHMINAVRYADDKAVVS